MVQTNDAELAFTDEIPKRPLKILFADDLPMQIYNYRNVILKKIRAHFKDLRTCFKGDVQIPTFESYFSRSLDFPYQDTRDDGTLDTRSKPVAQWFVDEPDIEFDVVVTDLKFVDPDYPSMGHATTGLDILRFIRDRQRFEPVFILVTGYEQEMIDLGRQNWLQTLGGDNGRYLDPRNFIGKNFNPNLEYFRARIEAALSEAEARRLERETVLKEPYSLRLIIQGDSQAPARPLPAEMPPLPTGEMGVLIHHYVSEAVICFEVGHPDFKQFIWALANHTEHWQDFAAIQERLNGLTFSQGANQIASQLRARIRDHATRIVGRWPAVRHHRCSDDANQLKQDLSVPKRTAHHDATLPICPCCVLASRSHLGYRILAPRSRVTFVEVSNVKSAIERIEQKYNLL